MKHLRKKISEADHCNILLFSNVPKQSIRGPSYILQAPHTLLYQSNNKSFINQVSTQVKPKLKEEKIPQHAALSSFPSHFLVLVSPNFDSVVYLKFNCLVLYNLPKVDTHISYFRSSPATGVDENFCMCWDPSS